MIVRLIALVIVLAFAALGLLLPKTPPPILIEEHPAALSTGDIAAANEWLSPCPLTARNLPPAKEPLT